MQNLEKRDETLSVVIPAYDESARIVPTLQKIFSYCSEVFSHFEIIVVNDGSRDTTEKVLEYMKKDIPVLRYISYKQNRGKGYALREGVLSASKNLILISDADLSTPIEELQKLLPYLDEGYDIVIGSRVIEGSIIAVRQPWWREAMGKIFNRIIKLALPLQFRDTQCGFKLFRGDCGRKIFTEATTDRFAYDVEILFIAQRKGYKIKEAPIVWHNSPASKVQPIKDSLQMLKDVVKIRMKYL